MSTCDLSCNKCKFNFSVEEPHGTDTVQCPECKSVFILEFKEFCYCEYCQSEEVGYFDLGEEVK